MPAKRKIGVCSKGRYPASVGGKNSPEYRLWDNMLNRCYNTTALKGRPTYIDTVVSENFLDFQYFAEWCQSQVGFGKEKFQLDKDLLSRGAKVYSEEVCVFVPNILNSLVCSKPVSKYGSPTGVYWDKKNSNYLVQLHDINGKMISKGKYANKDEALQVYKSEKLKLAAELADKFKNQIDVRVYNTLLNGDFLKVVSNQAGVYE